jgi:hypothetical protein
LIKTNPKSENLIPNDPIKKNRSKINQNPTKKNQIFKKKEQNLSKKSTKNQKKPKKKKPKKKKKTDLLSSGMSFVNDPLMSTFIDWIVLLSILGR